MHQSSFDKMTKFRKVFLSNKEQEQLTILDLGSQYIGSGKSYRDIFDRYPWVYKGIDMVSGDNVDLVLDDPYSWSQIESDSVDVLVSGQALEHVEFFWLTFQEITRVLKPGGLCCIIVPSSGPEHCYPVDCWRFYPDAFRALARYSKLDLLHVDTQWGELGYTDTSDDWHDTIMVARKPLVETPAFDNEPSPDALSQAMSMQPEDINTQVEDSSQSEELDYYNIVRHDIIPLIPEEAKCILDVGCGAGATGKYLKEKNGAFVAGIELNSEVAEEASQVLDDVVNGNVETMDVPYREGSFDCIVYADVLEHLVDPLSVLKKYKQCLKQNGTIIASIPNVRFHEVLGQLVDGNWTYQDSGILDRTHLRFFTLNEIKKLFSEAGLEMCGIYANADPNFGEIQKSNPRKIKIGKLEIGDLTPEELQEFFVIQYKIVARPKALNKSEESAREESLQKISSSTHEALVSVVIPVYNGQQFIADCLESVLAQTHSNLEIILCDDGSTDGTEAIVKGYRDPRIQWHPSKVNLGQAKNLNRGIRLARGEYICWLNQDDLFHEDKIRQQLNEFQKRSELGAVFANRMDVDVQLNEISIPYSHEFFAFSGSREKVLKLLLMYGCFLYAPSVMIRSEVFKDIGYFNEGYEICFDFDMWLRMAHKYPIANMDQKLLTCRHHTGNTSARPENEETLETEMYKIYLGEIERIGMKHLLPDEPGDMEFSGESIEDEAEFWVSMSKFFVEYGGTPMSKVACGEGFLKRAEGLTVVH